MNAKKIYLNAKKNRRKYLRKGAVKYYRYIKHYIKKQSRKGECSYEFRKKHFEQKHILGVKFFALKHKDFIVQTGIDDEHHALYIIIDLNLVLNNNF